MGVNPGRLINTISIEKMRLPGLGQSPKDHMTSPNIANVCT